MSRTLHTPVTIGLGLVVALLLLSASLAYRNTRQLNDDATRVTNTQVVLNLTSDVMLRLDGLGRKSAEEASAFIAAGKGTAQMDAIRQHVAEMEKAETDLLQEFQPDVLLLDIGLPTLNGYEVWRRIREQSWGKGIVLIAVTGWGHDDDRRRAQEAGFDHHMVKPVDPQALMKLLARLDGDMPSYVA